MRLDHLLSKEFFLHPKLRTKYVKYQGILSLKLLFLILSVEVFLSILSKYFVFFVLFCF